MKLTDLLNEGKYGPGSQGPIKLRDKNWKGTLGCIENKRRPEAIYFTLETWVKPRLSSAKAVALGGSDADSLAQEAVKDFEVELKRVQSQLRAFFDTLYFDSDSIIFTYDFDGHRVAKPGKPLFFKMELNIDTVNDIDANEEPAPNRKTGKTEFLHFDQFKGPAKDAAEKILKLPVFSRSAVVEFQKTKRG
jgi:hypothetical protein